MSTYVSNDGASHELVGDVARARDIAHGLLATTWPNRWAHVVQVARNVALIVAEDWRCADAAPAAWLHDIGYAVAMSGFHPLDGARHARALGMTDAVCGLIAFHTGARVEASKRGFLDVLEAEFVDVPSPARDALWAADATTGPDGQRLTLDERLAEIAHRYGADHLVSECSHQMAPELAAVIARVRARVPLAFERR